MNPILSRRNEIFQEILRNVAVTGNRKCSRTGLPHPMRRRGNGFLAEFELKTKKLHAILNMERGLAWRFRGGIGTLKT